MNCTSLGMVGKPPLEVDIAPLKPGAVVYDVVYVPLETGLLAAAQGARAPRGRRPGHAAPAGRLRVPEVVRGNPQVTPELREMIEADIRAKTGR